MTAHDRRLDVARALARTLPTQSVLVSIGIPGTGPAVWISQAGRGFSRLDLLSMPLLSAFGPYAPSLLRSHEGPVVGSGDGEGWRDGRLRLGGHAVFQRSPSVRYHDLAMVLGQVARPGLLHVAAAPGHVRLMADVLPRLTSWPAPIWIDLATPSDIEVISAAPGSEAFDLCGVTVEAGLTDLQGLSVEKGGGALLLVPRASYALDGLDRMKQEETTPDFRAPLLMPRSRGISSALATRLRVAARPTPAAASQRPAKLFRGPGEGVWDRGMRLSEDGAGTPLLHTLWQAEAGLLFSAPPGRYRLGVVLGSMPEPEMLAKLTAWVGPTRIPLRWHPEWWQLSTDGMQVETIGDAPFEILFRMDRAGGSAQLKLTIKGVEIELDRSMAEDGASFRTSVTADPLPENGDVRRA